MKERVLRRPLTRTALPRQWIRVIETCCLTVLGFLLSQATVFDSLAPFGIAFAASVPRGRINIFVAAGVAMGTIVPGGAGQPLRYLAALATVLAIQWIFGPFKKMARHPAYAPISAFIAMAATGAALLPVYGTGVASLLSVGAESLLCGGSAFFFAVSLRILWEGRRITTLSRQELCSVVVSAAAILVALSRLDIAGISVGRILAVLMILLAAFYGRESCGSIVGVATGLIMSLSSADMAHLGGAYAIGGLMAGLFSPLNRLASALAFIVSNGIVAIRVGGSASVYAGLFEVMIASILFILFPTDWGISLRKVLDPKVTAIPVTEGLRKSVVMRLQFASKSLGEISQSVDAASKKLRKMTTPNLDTTFSQATDRVCRNCGLSMFCWGPACYDTQNAVNDFTSILRKNGHIERSDIPAYFSKRCCHVDDFLREINASYRDYAVREAAERRVAEVRGAVVDQFEGMADMIGELAEQLDEAQSFDQPCANRVAEVLSQFDLPPADVSCLLDRFDRMTVTAVVTGYDGQSVSLRKLTQAVGDACDRIFEMPGVASIHDQTRLTFCQQAVYRLSIGCAQRSYQDGPLCGDSCESFFDGQGRAVLMISDGMGSGGRAAVEGAMTTSLLGQLIKAGFGFDNSLGVVNSALMCKSRDEALSTLDVACFDLYTGHLQLMKAGAPLTLIRKNGKVISCDTASLPVGILRDISFEHSEIRLKEGDIVLMVSDGAICSGTDWMEAELTAAGQFTAQQLAERIVQQARLRRLDGKDDDITALVGIVKKGV